MKLSCELKFQFVRYYYTEIQLAFYIDLIAYSMWTHLLVTAVQYIVEVSSLDILVLLMLIEGNVFSVLLLSVVLVVSILQM